MPALIYYSQRAMQELAPELESKLEYDQAQCALGVTCHREYAVADKTFAFNAGVGVVAVGEDDHPAWAPVVVITNPHDEDKPVLACVDCAEWLSEALGFKVEDAEDV